jgi:hypothetical protein
VGADHGVDLQSGIVTVVVHFCVSRLGVDAKVTHDQRLEQEAEQLEILSELIGPRPERCHRKRWVHQVSLRSVAED